MALFGLYTSKKEKEALRIKAEEELVKKQNEYGQELYKSLCKAGSENTVVRKFKDGTVSENIGNIIVSTIPENGSNYSIIVAVENFAIGSPKHYNLWQMDVNVQKGELHVFKCSYGPDSYYPLSSFQQKKTELSDMVRNYRLFN
jgi:hypothetical protein